MALMLEPQYAQRKDMQFNSEMLLRFVSNGEAWAVRRNGKLVAIGGHTPVWPGRTVVWGFLGADCGPALPVMTKEVRRQIKRLHVDFPRLEAYTERHHEAGHRWLKLLGFKHEGIMRKFYNGTDYALYGKVE